MKSFKKTKSFIPRFFERTYPSSLPHFGTFDMKTELSSTGPAIPIAAISGYLLRGMSDKNYRKAFSKVS